MNRPITLRLGALTALCLAATLVGCKRPEPPKACDIPEPINGRVTLPMNESGARIHLPYFRALYWTADCKYVQSIDMAFQWNDNKLLANMTAPRRNKDDPHIRVHLFVKAAPPPNPNFPPPEPWRFEHPIQHKKYPVELYPRLNWTAPDDPSPRKIDTSGPHHGVQGTLSPVNGRPFRTHCDLSLPEVGKPESFVNSDFSEGHGDAKCVGAVRVGGAHGEISATITVHRAGVSQLTQIYKAVFQFMNESIKD